ncbi:MAG: hypothetical protein ACRDJF_06600 [Actinomycetota bacterium]
MANVECRDRRSSEDNVEADLLTSSTAYRLARALVDRLSGLVPSGVSVSSTAAVVTMGSATRSEDTEIERIVDQDGDLRENVEAAALLVLDDLQDLLSECLKAPWPPVAGAPSELVSPQVEWSGDRLRLWYGDVDRPVLELCPIPVEELNLA